MTLISPPSNTLTKLPLFLSFSFAETIFKDSVKEREEIIFVSENYKNIISSLSLTESLNIVSVKENERNKGSFVKVFEGGEINVNLIGIIDFEAEKKRLEKEASNYKKDLEAVNKKLSNENFINKAKQEAIEIEKRKQKEFEDKLKGINEVLSSF